MPFSKLCFPRQLSEQLWERERKAGHSQLPGPVSFLAPEGGMPCVPR